MTLNDQLRAVSCCPAGCRDERRCDRNQAHHRAVADAAERLLADKVREVFTTKQPGPYSRTRQSETD